MVTFDTNYLIRHLVQDDPNQSKMVSEVFRREVEAGRTILLFDIVLCETVWVLRSAYGATRKDILSALTTLTEDQGFEFENPERVKKAIQRFKKGDADLADYLLLEKCKESGRNFLTFDKKIQKEFQK